MNELIEYEYQQKIKDQQAEIAQRDGQIAALLQEQSRLFQLTNFAETPLKVPKWTLPKKKKHGDHVAIAVSIMSDWHFDETVNPSEMSGHNAYDRAIATMRLRDYFENIVKITTHYWSGNRYEGFVLMGGGDLFTGLIHGELDRTNDGQGPYDSLVYYAPLVAAGIKLLADEFGRVLIPWTVGNHGRFREGKWGHKTRVRENLDWLLGQWLQMEFANDERVTFVIPDDPDIPFPIYDTQFLLNHGVAGGGNGQAGIFTAVKSLVWKSRQRWQFDVAVLGHWHQLVHAPGQSFIVNGSGKGFDEFARDYRFQPERAQQALWLVTPEHGITEHAPVLVTNRKSEGW